MDGDAPLSGMEKCTPGTTGSATIAGYFPGSDVTQHNALDLDQKAMVDELAKNDGGNPQVNTPDFPAAKRIYENGGVSTTNSACESGKPCFNSMSKGKARTLKGFSTGAKAKMYDGEAATRPYRHYKMFYDYYGDFDYADKRVTQALDGTAQTFTSGRHSSGLTFSGLGNAARIEAVKKGTAYMHVWMYAIREFEDAIEDCTTCVSDCNEHSTNSGQVHAWDEGVAFYTGSLEGTAAGVDSAGQMVHHLADKRCENFKTCGLAGGATDGTSQVNTELFKAGGLFAQGRDLLQQGHCAQVRPVIDQIVSLMTVPLVQGTLRYAWKVGVTGGGGNSASSQTSKNKAEGATFAAAVLPLVHYCNSAAATIVSDHMKFGADAPNTTDVKSALEDTYACLGITCAHVGELMNGTAPYTGMEKCTPGDTGSATIAGYFPCSDVTQHNALDLDQKAMVDELPDFPAAKRIYEHGGNSTTNSACETGDPCFNSMSKGSARTLKGFSTGAKAKMYDEDGKPASRPYKHYEMFYDYYGDFDYADKWVTQALDGTAQTFTSGRHSSGLTFSGLGNAARIEAVKKGTAYMHVWMYAIREFEDAIEDCTTCVSDCNEHSTNS